MKNITALAAALLASAVSVSSANAETYVELLDRSSKAIVAQQFRAGLAVSREMVALPYLTRAQQAVAYNHLCINLSQIGRTSDALRACNQAVALDDKAYGSYVNRGNVLSALGYRPAARADYRVAKQLSPTAKAVNVAATLQSETPYVFLRPAGGASTQQAQNPQGFAE